MRENIKQLIDSNLSAYRAAKDTGIPNNTVVRIFSGETAIEKVRFEVIEKLSKYWEENKMKQAFETVLEALEGKIGEENGVAYYKDVTEFFEVTNHRSTEGLSSWKDNGLTDSYKGEFVAYDYNNSEFLFLTDVNELQTFIDRILAN